MRNITRIIALLGVLAFNFAHAADYDCQVFKLENDAFFDTSLEEYGQGDEGYAYVSTRTDENSLKITVGGLEYPLNSSSSVETTEVNAKGWIKVIEDGKVKFSFVQDRANGKAYLIEGEDLSKKIVLLNCYYQQGFNPFEAGSIALD